MGGEGFRGFGYVVSCWRFGKEMAGIVNEDVFLDEKNKLQTCSVTWQVSKSQLPVSKLSIVKGI